MILIGMPTILMRPLLQEFGHRRRMDKFKLKNDRVWVVICDDGFHSAEVSFEKAKKEAIRLCDDGGMEIHILEVVGVWRAEYPEEPNPIVFEISLGNL